MNSFIEDLRARASALDCSVLFPEAHDDRVLRAVTELASGKILRPVLVLDPARPETHAAAKATGAATMVSDGGRFGVRRSPGRVRDFDATVAGRVTTPTFEAALRTIGVWPGLKTVSSAFYMVASRDGKHLHQC